jgi:hypothetical protein
MIESQEHLLSYGKVSGFGPKLMKQAAARLVAVLIGIDPVSDEISNR